MTRSITAPPDPAPPDTTRPNLKGSDPFRFDLRDATPFAHLPDSPFSAQLRRIALAGEPKETIKGSDPFRFGRTLVSVAFAPLRLVAPARPLRVVDVALFYGERSGGIRTYLDAKAAYAARTGAFEHRLVVPGDVPSVCVGAEQRLPLAARLAAAGGPAARIGARRGAPARPVLGAARGGERRPLGRVPGS